MGDHKGRPYGRPEAYVATESPHVERRSRDAAGAVGRTRSGVRFQQLSQHRKNLKVGASRMLYSF